MNKTYFHKVHVEGKKSIKVKRPVVQIRFSVPDTTVDHCPEHQFDCYSNGQKCIDYKLVCDGFKNCETWEDEHQELCDGTCLFK